MLIMDGKVGGGKAGKRQVPVGQREGREREWNNGMLANRDCQEKLKAQNSKKR
jgi:hypothetical protein